MVSMPDPDALAHGGMTAPAGSPIVVGVDGSTESRAAVELAARLASSRHRPLRLVHAFIWPLMHVSMGPSPEGPPEGGLRHQAERIVAEAVGLAVQGHPDLDVAGEVVTGAPSAVLLEEAPRAAMVVLGHRGLGGFTGLLVGSVAVQVAAHATCPVLVARGVADRPLDILVGVDGSKADAATLAFGFEEASMRGVGLTALHAYTHPVANWPGDMLLPVYDAQQLETEESEILAETLAGGGERFPDVVVHRKVVHGRASRALVEAADRAGLVVVGCRGRGGFSGLLLGSVSQALLHHASCPVVIVRGR